MILQDPNPRSQDQEIRSKEPEKRLSLLAHFHFDQTSFNNVLLFSLSIFLNNHQFE